MKNTKLKILSIPFVFGIVIILLPSNNSYSDNTVEKIQSSVIYDNQVIDRGLDNEIYSYNSLDTINGQDDSEIDIMSLSISSYNVEEPIEGITMSLSRVCDEDIEKLTSDYMWTTDRVNLRSEASTNSDKILTLDKRTKIQMISSSNKWTKVKYEDYEGYIYTTYLRDTELPSLDFTDEEIEILQRITEAECTGQSIESKENVVSVIINRILDLNFPDTMSEIVFQDGQFSPISDGRYYSVDITKDTIEAVDNILKDGVKHEGIFFCNMKDVKLLSKKNWFKNLEFLFKDDSGHSFYK